MNPEQQRIAIAEWCGWKVLDTTTDINGKEVRWWSKTSSILDAEANGIPDYLNDLNAMHEAEERLLPSNLANTKEGSLWPLFVCELADVVKENDGSNIHATAAQRAEALLKTIGKWKD